MTAARSPWRPVSTVPDHPLRAVDGAAVAADVTLAIELGAQNHVGSDCFRAFLVSAQHGATTTPVIGGLCNRGPFPGYNWVEVAYASDRAPLAAGGVLAVTAAIDQRIVQALAAVVPPGGHLMLEYDSPHRATTARALAANVPPVATPLGALMFAASCGVAFTDWYISEGGREGPRKLQGFRALDAAHEQRRGRETVAALEAFLARADGLEAALAALTRPLAEAALATLRARTASPPGRPGADAV